MEGCMAAGLRLRSDDMKERWGAEFWDQASRDTRYVTDLSMVPVMGAWPGMGFSRSISILPHWFLCSV